MQVSDILVAVGLVLALEGMTYAAFPDGMKQVMRQLLEWPSATIRTTGLVAALVGVCLIWLVRM